MLYVSGLFQFLVPEQIADEHYHRKDYQVPEIRQLVADNAGVHHEQRADYRERGNDEAVHDRLIGGLAHPLDEDGQIHRVNGDDRQLRGVKQERHALKRGALEGDGSAPSPCEVRQIEVRAPYRAGYGYPVAENVLWQALFPDLAGRQD